MQYLYFLIHLTYPITIVTTIKVYTPLRPQISNSNINLHNNEDTLRAHFLFSSNCLLNAVSLISLLPLPQSFPVHILNPFPCSFFSFTPPLSNLGIKKTSAANRSLKAYNSPVKYYTEWFSQILLNTSPQGHFEKKKGEGGCLSG